MKKTYYMGMGLLVLLFLAACQPTEKALVGKAEGDGCTLGTDTDSDGTDNCDDTDDDNDGVGDSVDTAPLDPAICLDVDSDGCDDCSGVNDGFGRRPNYDPASDGPDTNGDGLCDPQTCQNGIKESTEECDDSNNVEGDGCSAICMVELGWDCSSGTCEEICGDSLLNGDETCDDGNTADGDYCSANCQIVTGSCGDGITQIGIETCDDSNAASGDGCSGTCIVEDEDGDGFIDSRDNCPTVSNPYQTDANGDGQGDACDTDSDTDSDGDYDNIDNCPSIANANQENSDYDGVGDACDFCLGTPASSTYVNSLGCEYPFSMISYRLQYATTLREQIRFMARLGRFMDMVLQ